MSITFVLHEATRTGAPRVGALIAAGLQKHEEVRVIALRDGPLVPWLEELLGKERLVVCPGEAFAYQVPFAERLRQAELLLAADSSDVVYVNSVAASVFVVAAKALGRRAVLHVHEKAAELRMLLRIEGTKMEIAALADGIVLAADELLAELSAVLGAPGDKVLNFGIVVDVEAMRRLAQAAMPPPRNAAGEPWSADGRIAVGMCGTASRRKGADIFLELAAQAPEFDFIWIGGWAPPDAPDNPVCGEFQTRALPNFYLTGSVDNPYAYLDRLTLFFLSSREDPNPLVLAELALLRVPILAFSSTTAVTDWLGRVGILCYGPPNVADALRVLKAIDPETIRAQDFRAPADELTAGFDLATKLDTLRQFIAAIRAEPAPAAKAEEMA